MPKDLNITPIEYELIEAQLVGTLSEEQVSQIRDLEFKDPDWSLKVEEVKSLRVDLESYLIKSELDKIHAEAFPRPAAKSIKIPSWVWAVAASVTLIVVAWASFTGVFQSPNQQLFEAYYETDPGLITAMSGSESYEFDRGMVDFKEGKYEEALALWKPLLEEKPESDTLSYFVAMANLETEDYAQSQRLLLKLLDQGSSEFEEDAKWYLGLIYLKTNEIEKARLLLSKSQRPEAKAILEELE